MSIYLSGKRVKSVFAKMNSLVYGRNKEDSSIVILTSVDGTTGTIETGYTYRTSKPEECYSFCTTKSYIVIRENKIKRVDREGQKIDIQPKPTNLYANFVENTLERFKGGSRPLVGLNDMHKVMRMVNMAYKSNLNNRVEIIL